MRKFCSFIVLLLAAVLVGCGQWHIGPSHHSWQDDYTHNAPLKGWNTVLMPYYVDKTFDADRQAQIHQAVDEWNLALNGRFAMSFAGLAGPIDDDFVEAHKDFDTRFFIREDATDPKMNDYAGALAFVDEIGGNKIHLIDQRLNFTFSPEIVIMHEIGHTFGLEHTELADTLMGTHYTEQPHCIDQYTMRTLAADQGWDWHTLNWCTP